MAPTNPIPPAPAAYPTGDRREELERIKAAMWPADEPADVRAERVRRALEAVARMTRPAYDFDAQTWKYIAESSEVYDDED